MNVRNIPSPKVDDDDELLCWGERDRDKKERNGAVLPRQNTLCPGAWCFIKSPRSCTVVAAILRQHPILSNVMMTTMIPMMMMLLLKLMSTQGLTVLFARLADQDEFIFGIKLTHTRTHTNVYRYTPIRQCKQPRQSAHKTSAV